MSSDVDFLGLERAEEPGRFRFVVANHLTRLDDRLYGGTAIAASIAAGELVSERPALWMTTQLVGTAPMGARISVLAEVLAHGRRVDQVRVTGSDDAGAVLFASLGATGHHRPDGLTGTFEHAPVVSPPAESRPDAGPFTLMLRNAGIEVDPDLLPPAVGFSTVVDFREPTIERHPDPGPGRLCIWVRRRDGIPLTPATVAFVADMVPLSVAHGLSVVAAGVSLDNTIRIGHVSEPTEWVLIDLRPHLAAGGYGHGAAHIWSEHGELLATASQSASMREMDLSDPSWTETDHGASRGSPGSSG
jgi:acyl-CoA thioesterase II